MHTYFSLINCIWRMNIKSWSWDMCGDKQINLPDGFLHQPKLCIIFRYFGFLSQLLKSRQPFPKAVPKAVRAIVDSWELFFPFWTNSQKKNLQLIPKSRYQQQRRSFHLAFVEHFACINRKAVALWDQDLDNAPSCKASKHNLFPPNSLFPASWLGHLIIQSRGFVRFSWFIGRLILLHRGITSLLLFFNTILVSTQIICEIASINKGGRIDERSSNNYCYAFHFIYTPH